MALPHLQGDASQGTNVVLSPDGSGQGEAFSNAAAGGEEVFVVFCSVLFGFVCFFADELVRSGILHHTYVRHLV